MSEGVERERERERKSIEWILTRRAAGERGEHDAERRNADREGESFL